MRYIKAKYVQPGGPCVDEYTVYGWDSVWTKKTTMIEGEAVEAGSVVQFQAVNVAPDGKLLVLATERNIKLLKACISAGQMKLAPGEKLEVDVIAAPKKTDEDVWPEAPNAKPVDEFDEPAETEEEVEPVAAAPKARRARKPADETPDIEA